MYAAMVVSFFAMAFLQSEGFNNQQGRIIGGKPVGTKAQSPYVRLHLGNKFWCGGSLITPKLVLTAAHCMLDGKARNYFVHANTNTRRNSGTVRRVKEIFKPSAFNDRTLNYDIAVLRLARAVPQITTKAIDILTLPVNIGTLCTVYGHGSTKREDESFNPMMLHAVTVPKVSCESYENIATITKTMFCAADYGYKDACFGDSGGPIICDGKLAGIVSWGESCASNKYPGVYTNCTYVKAPFIDKVISRFT